MDVGSILLACIGIGLLIFIHELGHFIAARLAGVRVEVFSLGFGPRLFGVELGGTDFRVSLVPFGGFVMVAGQDPTDRRYPTRESLFSKSLPQRALFWSGGVLMNALFALVVFPLVFHAGVSFDAPAIGTIDLGGAAWEAGIQRGDRVVSIGGKSLYSYDNLMVEAALTGGRPVNLELRGGDDSTRVVTATPQFDAVAGLYGLGVERAFDSTPPVITVEPGGAAAKAGLRTGDVLQKLDGKLPHLSVPLAVEPGQTIAVEVLRDGQPVTAAVAAAARTEGVPARIGVSSLPRRIVGMKPGSTLAERLGLRHGDVVLAIDGAPFTSGDLAAAPEAPPRTRWLVRRGDEVLGLEQSATADERRALAEHVVLGTDGESLLVFPKKGSAAANAGLQSGDRIVSVDGQAIDTWRNLVRAVESAGERTLRVDVWRLPPGAAEDALHNDVGNVTPLSIAPQRDPVGDLGFGWTMTPLQQMVQAESFGDALGLGFVCSLDLVKQLYVTLKRLVTGDVAAKNLGGIIRISQASYAAARRGPGWFWYFLALLSVNLAFVNLLPVPVLDGGHLLFLLIEKIKGSPVSTRVLGYSQVLGLVFVLLLVLFVTYNDILRLL